MAGRASREFKQSQGRISMPIITLRITSLTSPSVWSRRSYSGQCVIATGTEGIVGSNAPFIIISTESISANHVSKRRWRFWFLGRSDLVVSGRNDNGDGNRCFLMTQTSCSYAISIPVLSTRDDFHSLVPRRRSEPEQQGAPHRW